MNLASIIVILLVAAGFAAAVKHSHKGGCCGHVCGHNCRECSMNCKRKK